MRSPPASRPARVLDVHSDPDHGRSVFTLAGRQGELAQALLAGAREAVERIDLRGHDGSHPHVGAIDVAPVVYLDEERRGAACAEALTAAALIGDELGLPGVPLRRARHGRRPPRARRPAPRQPRAGRAHRARRARARLRPGEGSPARGRGARHRATAPARLQRGPRERRRGAREEHRRASCASRAADRAAFARSASASPRAGAPRCPSTCTTTAPCRSPSWSSACASRRPSRRPSSWASRRRRRFEGFPDDIPLRDFDPERHVLENALGSD